VYIECLAQAKQTIKGNISGTVARLQHLLPPAIAALLGGILVLKPDAHARDALEDGGKSVLVAFPDRDDALVEAVTLVRVGSDGGNEERPDWVSGGVEVALNRNGEEDSGECVIEFHHSRVEASEAGSMLV
jgi:hypothetical protein